MNMKYRWIYQMAWRDSRTQLWKLTLFVASITLGVGVLTAVGSFQKNLERSIYREAKTLLGADLVLTSRQPFSIETENLIRQWPAETAREILFPSMVFFPKTENSRLVQIRALEGPYPFYGTFETDPKDIGLSLDNGVMALVDENVLIQHQLKLGDIIKIGGQDFRVGGAIKKIPGETPSASFVAPRIYISMPRLKNTSLIQKGSMVWYRIFLKFPPGFDVEALLKKVEPLVLKNQLEVATVQKRMMELGQTSENLSRFFNLVAFGVLLLGGMGVASSILIHTKGKFSTVALLKCLGSSNREVFSIFLTQVTALSLLSSLVGILLGLGLERLLPLVVRDFLPLTIQTDWSWTISGRSLAIGFLTSFLFALSSLLRTRNVPPLLTLRSIPAPPQRVGVDPYQWLIQALIGCFIFVFAWLNTTRWFHAVFFSLGILTVLGLLAGTGKLVMVAAKSLPTSRWPYELRQGLANLYRPRNQTGMLLISLGLGTSLVTLIFLTQNVLLKQFFRADGSSGSNLALFDIQQDQRADLKNRLTSLNLPILDEVPIVNMRLVSLKGRSIGDIRKDPQNPIPNWALLREYRSTYRANLSKTEILLKGRLIGVHKPEEEVIPISIEKGIADTLRLGMGDEIVFDVEGLLVKTRISSVRKVDWYRVEPNFFMVFPRNVLEEAPTFFVLTTRAATKELSAQLQQKVRDEFPNVSSIDLDLILNSLKNYFDKVSFVLKVLASFAVFTGLVIMSGTLLTSRYNRLEECHLLRTLGAHKRQIRTILLVEYSLLGFFSALTGLALGILASWLISHFVFHISFVLSLIPILIIGLTLPVMAILIGMFNNQGILNRPPMEILKSG